MFEMDKCREEFEKAFPVPAHWIEYDEKSNRYYCPYVADATASTYQSKWVVWQHQQAKVEELQALYTQQGINMLKLQKRVDAALKLIESWNEIAFDKTTHWTEGYEEGCYHCAAQLEQALKGDQYDEHRKKAEEAISKGASLTNHRIEL